MMFIDTTSSIGLDVRTLKSSHKISRPCRRGFNTRPMSLRTTATSTLRRRPIVGLGLAAIEGGTARVVHTLFHLDPIAVRLATTTGQNVPRILLSAIFTSVRRTLVWSASIRLRQTGAGIGTAGVGDVVDYQGKCTVDVAESDLPIAQQLGTGRRRVGDAGRWRGSTGIGSVRHQTDHIVAGTQSSSAITDDSSDARIDVRRIAMIRTDIAGIGGTVISHVADDVIDHAEGLVSLTERVGDSSASDTQILIGRGSRSGGGANSTGCQTKNGEENGDALSKRNHVVSFGDWWMTMRMLKTLRAQSPVFNCQRLANKDRKLSARYRS